MNIRREKIKYDLKKYMLIKFKIYFVKKTTLLSIKYVQLLSIDHHEYTLFFIIMLEQENNFIYSSD